MDYPVGTVLKRPKARGAMTHFGIYLGEGRVFESLPPHGERIASFDDFARRQPVTAHRVLRLPEDELRRRVQASQERGRPYHFFTNNCEHSVNRIGTGSARSVQSLLLVVVTVLACLAFLA